MEDFLVIFEKKKPSPETNRQGVSFGQVGVSVPGNRQRQQRNIPSSQTPVGASVPGNRQQGSKLSFQEQVGTSVPGNRQQGNLSSKNNNRTISLLQPTRREENMLLFDTFKDLIEALIQKNREQYSDDKARLRVVTQLEAGLKQGLKHKTFKSVQEIKAYYEYAQATTFYEDLKTEFFAKSKVFDEKNKIVFNLDTKVFYVNVNSTKIFPLTQNLCGFAMSSEKNIYTEEKQQIFFFSIIFKKIVSDLEPNLERFEEYVQGIKFITDCQLSVRCLNPHFYMVNSMASESLRAYCTDECLFHEDGLPMILLEKTITEYSLDTEPEAVLVIYFKGYPIRSMVV